MKRKIRSADIISLVLGGIIGLAIALPDKVPEARDYAVRTWTRIQAAEQKRETDLNLALMILPESNADHGDTLEEVIHGIRYEKYEYVAGFYGERKMFELTNQDRGHTNYQFWWSTDLAPDIIEVHNHPVSGHSFSYIDLAKLCENQSVGTAIAVGCDGAVYTLAAPNGWPTQDEFESFFEDRFNINLSADGSVATTVLTKLERKGYINVRYDDGTIYVGFTSKIVAEFAEYFDLVYTVDYLPDEE